MRRSSTVVNAFTGLGKRRIRETNYVDIDTLTIARDPLPKKRASPNKYGDVFTQLKFGDCIKCQPDQVSTIGHALNVWLKRTGRPGKAKTMRRYADGAGRVWLCQA